MNSTTRHMYQSLLQKIRSVHKQRASTTRLRIREQILLVKQLAYLIGANIPILESITTVKMQSENKKITSLLETIENDVRQGLSLSKSIARHPHTFSPLIPAVIDVGEQSGTLPQSLSFLAEELRKKYILRKKIIGALIYPAIVTVATLSIVGSLTLFIFPKIIPIFTSMHVSLPLSTRIVLAVSQYIQLYWLYLALGTLMLCGAFYILYTKFLPFRLICEAVSIRIPVAGTLMHTYTMANFYRTLGILLGSGITLTDAILITQRTLRNERCRAACATLHTELHRGKKLSYGMAETKRIFSPTALHIIAVGEQTGNLTAVITYLGEMYELEVDDLTKNLSNAVEPILMLIMGLLVGFIALSIVTPIYEITQHLKSR